MRAISKTVVLTASSQFIWLLKPCRVLLGAQLISTPSDNKYVFVDFFDEGKTVDDKNGSPILRLNHRRFSNVNFSTEECLKFVQLKEGIPITSLRMEIFSDEAITITVIVYTN